MLDWACGGGGWVVVDEGGGGGGGEEGEGESFGGKDTGAGRVEDVVNPALSPA